MIRDANSKLKERVKELNCLYELLRAAQDAHDVDVFISKTLTIIPAAMQFPELAEVEIHVAKSKFTTAGFKKSKVTISARLNVEHKVYGSMKIGYRSHPGKRLNPSFLTEEKHLLKAAARELSSFISKVSAEKEKEKLQTQLQHSERLAFIGELSAGIAHELNEPLAKILGFAQLIKKTGHLTDQQTDDIDRIVKASLYTREIIKKLMIFSRQMPQQIMPVNLNDIITNILYFIDVRFQASQIKLKTKLHPALPTIKGDEVQLSQVLVNLITNAVHAMPGGGTISIATKAKGTDVILIVSDTGTGMSSTVRHKIFEPFFTTKAVGQGTGLGLSVVKGIVDAHHGRISVHSSPGRGTKFEIQLPIKG